MPTELNQKKLEVLKLKNKDLKEEFDRGVELVNEVKSKNSLLVTKIEEQKNIQASLLAKIDYVKNQNKIFETSFVMREKILREERQKTQEIASKQSSIQQSKKQYANNTIENNFQKLQATIFAPQNHLKARSILLTCLEELIRTTEANEFDPFSWKVKVDSNDSLVGGRILLSDISIYKTDIDGLYRPLIDSLSRKFSKSQLSIQTKTKSHDGVITLLDVTITVPLISIVQEVGEIRS